MQKENFSETYAKGEEPAQLKVSSGLRRIVEVVGRCGLLVHRAAGARNCAGRRGPQADVPHRRGPRLGLADLSERASQPLLRVDPAAGIRVAPAHRPVRARAGLRHDLQHPRARRPRSRPRQLPQEDLDRVPGAVVLHDPLPAARHLFRLQLGVQLLRARRNLGVDRRPEPPLDHQGHPRVRPDHSDDRRHRCLAAGGDAYVGQEYQALQADDAGLAGGSRPGSRARSASCSTRRPGCRRQP